MKLEKNIFLNKIREQICIILKLAVLFFIEITLIIGLIMGFCRHPMIISLCIFIVIYLYKTDEGPTDIIPICHNIIVFVVVISNVI